IPRVGAGPLPCPVVRSCTVTRPELAHKKPRAHRTSSARLVEILPSRFTVFSIFVSKKRACCGQRACQNAGAGGLRDPNRHRYLKSILCLPTAPGLPIGRKRGLRYVPVFWAALRKAKRSTVRGRYPVSGPMPMAELGRERKSGR